MAFFVLKRLLGLIPILLAVITITFFLMRMAPGNPFEKDRKIPAYIEQQLLAKYKLDGPVWQQYVHYLADVARGDLRLSTKYRDRSVNDIIGQTLPVSMTLGAVAFVIALGVGVVAGTLAATQHNKMGDHVAMLAALVSISVPNYVVAPLLILVFGLMWSVLPVAGWGTLQQMILPALCLALPFAAYVARLMRTSMLETIHQDFVRTARAKGLSETKVIYKHALKVAILPVVSFAGPLAANIMTGSLVIEEIFKIPGMGNFFVLGVLNRDLFLVSGCVIVYCVLLVVMNLIVDVAYTWLDRRIKLS